MIKGEKLFQPVALTPLSPFDVEAVSRDADRIIERAKRKRPSLETSGSAFRRRLRRLSKSYASFLDTSMSPSTLSSTQQSRRDSVGSKSRDSVRSNSSTSQKVGKGATKKRPGKKSGKGIGKGVGDVAKSGNTKLEEEREGGETTPPRQGPPCSRRQVDRNSGATVPAARAHLRVSGVQSMRAECPRGQLWLCSMRCIR
ncbi:hypothetical protein MTO96_000365 [Rhipicephalus appendiculatus]